MNHLEKLRLDAAAKLEDLVNLPDQAQGSQAQTEKTIRVVDAIATYTISTFMAGPGQPINTSALKAAGADAHERAILRQADDLGTKRDPTPDG